MSRHKNQLELMSAEAQADIVLRVAAECRDFLSASFDADWSVPIPGLEWSVSDAVVHMTQALLWYSTDLSAGPNELSTMNIKVHDDATPEELGATISSFSRMFASVVRCTSPDDRGWHPYGIADSSGFVAMACDEMLVHTYDAGNGLGREFHPPDELASLTLYRLFPWAPEDVDPWLGLKWANGRCELPGRNVLSEWRWICAPLSEWDGVLGMPTGN